MSGNGKYTVYGSPAGAKYTFLKKLFGVNVPVGDGPGTAAPQVALEPGAEKDVLAQVVSIAKANLQPAHQSGDLGYFPTGVDLDFRNAPNVADVKWNLSGDPANPYAPDISSPGPGKTEGTDKDKDPQIKTTDIKPSYVAGAPGTGTKSPSATDAKIVAASLLGVTAKLGDSGGNV